MREIFIEEQNRDRKIALVEEGILKEFYQETENKERMEGNIYLGKVKDILPGMQAAFVDIGLKRNAFIHMKDIIPKVSNETGNKQESLEKYRIQDYIKQDKNILVQVKKDSSDAKGARITCHIHIPGRFVVLVTENEFITTSQKIADKKEKERLIQITQNMLKNIKKPRERMGFIIRTAAQGIEEKELQEDISKLVAIWRKMQEGKESKDVPKILYQRGSILQKMLLDFIDQGIHKIIVNEEKIKKEIEEEIKKIQYKENTIIIEVQQNIWDRYQLAKQIEKIQDRKIWLNCGGFITIDKTEALTAIDVNSGKYTGKKSLEETVLKVNAEASKEIAKQLRLRDIGGIIMIDFIDMQEETSRKKIVKLLEESLREDRSKTQIVEFTKLSLLEMTRKHIWNHP